MKATLTFNLPDDADQFIAAQDGIKWALLVQELDNQLRTTEKYSADPVEAEWAAEIRATIRGLMDDDALRFPS